MKSLAIGCALLGLVACGSLPPFNPTTGGSSSGSSSTGKATTGTAAGANSTTGASTTGTSSGPGTTGSSTGSSTGPATSSGGTGTGSSSGNGTTSGSYIGLPCSYNSQTGVDSCAPYGYECTAEYDLAVPGTCVLPQELAICNSEVGCQTGGSPALVCTPGFMNNGKAVSICAYPCTKTSDCKESFENCQAGVCFYNFCDKGPFYGTCPVDDAGAKGQCLPFNNDGFAFCYQTGFDFEGEACNPDPDARTGAFSQCSAGNFCVSSQPSGDGGLCLPITSDGGCPLGNDAFAYYTNGDWAVCLQDCADAGPPECDYGNCYNYTPTGQQMCFPDTN